MARADLRDELAAIVDESVKAGGKIVTGGPVTLPDFPKGFFYAPTVMTVDPSMSVFNKVAGLPLAPL